MKKIELLLIICLSLFLSCNDDKNDDGDDFKIVTLKIASDTTISIDPVSGQDVEVLLMWDELNSKWVYITQEIRGFTYEKGYEYVLKVKEFKIKYPFQDASDIEYELLEILSKEKKILENLSN